MSRLIESMKDQLCAEVHQKYQQRKLRGRPPTPFYPSVKPHPATRLPPIESGNAGGAMNSPDFSILRFRFDADDLRDYGCSYDKTLVQDISPPSSPLDRNTSFGSRRLPNIKKKNKVTDRDLVKKWSESTCLHKKPHRNYGTNEILSIAIQRYGRGVKVSRTCDRNKAASGFRQAPAALPPIFEEKEPQTTFITKFKPARVNDDNVLIARERKEFYSYGLYKNPIPHDHRGVS